MKEKLHYILLLITVLLVAGISLANMQSVNVSFILFSFKLPLIILILISVLLGSITTFLISMVKNFSLKKDLKKTKEVLENLRTKN
ncbi:lipopolysaccharide assembly protein LapA domain-containing protein [Streptococcus gordonii]|uniref:lipopolysaccharide assembly protein LapA domain-containing protein n=1 Tax=Streptococcus gordonii TaxID=1302 RepID=UPI001CC190DA|nr:lipopolysaccharide assembly protein LapA domain-containing protein [Streptococcus gordonii]MBZ2133684.1 lipopolysaccharide assembly protein LapA domain-containing protein [Streptococcus gordonii]MBZ2142808.1 lipopolysaccharide assembly protein LapA domain-containing protein [Streptococcus gordonii]MBZ2144789.1 lipopolysaccharide assembly protein LapA domain-containing protein [Streptococcus gordonii]MBZ2147038.1 lipopolysaccharide assembly protein LapA domain-containing protein [Streptococcu